MDQCIHCNRQLAVTEDVIKTAEKDQCIKVVLFAQSYGMRPRLKSAAEMICFCAPCAASLAFGPEPEGALYQAAWRRLRELVGADSAVAQLAWDRLHTATNPAPRQLGTSLGEDPIRLPFGEGARVVA